MPAFSPSSIDGLPSYVKAFQGTFGSKLPRYGQPGRCKWRAWPELAIAQVVKKRTSGHCEVNHRLVQGCADQIKALLQTSQGQGGINTAFIERLNATFRQRLNVLARRTRTLARQPETLHAGMYVVGCSYN
jgi:IS1 family transposase